MLVGILVKGGIELLYHVQSCLSDCGAMRGHGIF